MISSLHTYYYDSEKNNEMKDKINKGEKSDNNSNWENFVSLIMDLKSYDDDDADIIVLSCPSTSILGSFRCYLDLTTLLRQKLTKVADSLAQVAQQGAASQNASI